MSGAEYYEMTSLYDNSEGIFASIIASMAAFSLIYGIIGILTIVALWKIYNKCGKPGWASIIPIYNIWVLFEIVGLPGWLSLIPVANGIGVLYSMFKLGEKFNKGVGFSLGLIFLSPIFLLILAFGKNKEENVMESNEAVEQPVNTFANGPVDLMQADPALNNPAPVTPVVPVAPVMTEAPSLESQMMASEPQAPIVEQPLVTEPVMQNNPIPNEVVNTTVENNTNVVGDINPSGLNAFEMPAPAAPVMGTPDIMEPVNNVGNTVVTNDVLDIPAPVVEMPAQVNEPEMEIPVPIVQNNAFDNNVPQNITTTNVEEPALIFPQENSAPVAPSMPSAEIIEPVVQPVINVEPAQETVNLQKTQKFCPNCGNPNDVLNKFCVSCGYTF